MVLEYQTKSTREMVEKVQVTCKQECSVEVSSILAGLFKVGFEFEPLQRLLAYDKMRALYVYLGRVEDLEHSTRVVDLLGDTITLMVKEATSASNSAQKE